MPALIAHAKAVGVQLPPGTDDDGANLSAAELVQLVRDICLHVFPGLAGTRIPA